MIIHNTEILPGEVKTLEVNIAKLPSHSPIDISITVARAKEEGPTILLSGGLHGDEINGIEVVRRIIEGGWNVPKCGTIICIPIINIYGFIHFSRYVPDGKDVNRSFPGSKTGSLASRVAYYLTQDILPKIDVGIDFHTGGDDRTNYPQIRCVMTDNTNKTLSAVFNAPFTLHSTYRPQSIRQAAAKMGKHILVYEGGESSRFDEFAIQQGVNGTLRVLKYYEMIEEELEPVDYQNVYIKNSSWVRAKSSGIFQTQVKSGDYVKKNQLVGKITDPFGDYTVPLKSSANGYVIGLNNNPIMHAGDAVMHIGVTHS